jgi:peptidoglycan/LPS O-acetylase OafA/YrhL
MRTISQNDNYSLNKLSMTDNRNGELDLLRLVFCIMVLLVHLDDKYAVYLIENHHKLGCYGWFGVEFFFMISGLFLAEHHNREEKNLIIEDAPNEIWTYILHKVKYISKYYIPMLAIQFVQGIVDLHNVTAANVVGYLPSIFYLNNIPNVPGTLHLLGDWYLSVLIICSLVIYSLIVYKKDLYTKIIAPLSFIIITSYFLRKYNSIALVVNADFINGGLLRGLAVMSLGVCAYELSKIITKIKNIHIIRTLVIIKYLLFFICIKFSLGYYDELYSLSFLLALFIAVSISYSGIGFIVKGNKITYYIAKLSLSMYLVHGIIYTWLINNKVVFDNKLIVPLIIILFVAIVSIVYIFVVDFFSVAFKNRVKTKR